MEHFWLAIDGLASKRGVHCFLSFPKVSDISGRIRESNIKVVELDVDLKDRRKLRKVQKFIKDHNISAIYFTDRPYFDFNYLPLRLSGVKTIIVHDHTPGDRPPILGLKGLLKMFRNKLRYVTADMFLNVSKLMRQRSLLNGRIPDDKCKVVQNGIPLRSISRNTNYIREELGIPKDAIVAVTTGRAHPYKRVDHIVKAAIKLLKKNSKKDVYFLIVGDGPDLQKIIDLVQVNQMGSRIKVLGFRKDVWEILEDSDFAIHASLGEGFSLSIIEYMAASLPVFVPDIPSVSQAVIHMENGIIYPKDDVDALVHYLDYLSGRIDIIHQLGRNARRKVEKEYNIDQCTSRFISVVEPIIFQEY